MKKIFIALIVIASIFPLSFQTSYAREISFIYINGSGNNEQKTKDWFFEGVNKLHPFMKKAFETNDFTCEKFLMKGQDSIKQEPVIFFWGEMSRVEIEKLGQKLHYAKMLSPKIAQFVREVFAYWIHDAIWVSKSQNMKPITDKLHEDVMSEYNNGNQIVLLGYSAGSFVSYEYLLRKSRYIDTNRFLDHLKEAEEENEENSTYLKLENTCIDAVEKSNIAFSSSSSKLIINQDLNQIKEIYPKLDEYSDKYCVPDDAVKGVINFASPFSLFYSEIADFNKIMNAKSRLLYIYIIESNKFLLTVNWANDPLGFPVAKNLSFEDVEELFDVHLKPNLGYVHDKSDRKSRTPFFFAHDSYWSNSKRFAETVVQAYREGYLNYYGK